MRSKKPSELAQSRFRTRDMLQHFGTKDRVKRAIRFWDRRDIADNVQLPIVPTLHMQPRLMRFSPLRFGTILGEVLANVTKMRTMFLVFLLAGPRIQQA